MEQLSLFDDLQENSLEKTGSLHVVKAKFESQEVLSWQDLFEGFDELYVITYSSGLQFIGQVLKKFSYSEIIFGCEEIMDYSLESIIASQIANVESICKSKVSKILLEKVNNKELKLFVSRDVKSHEKLFVLKSKEGKERVIVGSANMSASAFGGIQRENIIYFDDEEAFIYYKKRFEDFKEECSDNISTKVLSKMIGGEEELLRDNPQSIPICETVKVKKAMVIEETEDEEAEIVADVTGIKNIIKPVIPREKKSEKIFLTVDKIEHFEKKFKDSRKVEKEREKQLPKLHIDIEKGTMAFNGKEFDLSPKKEDIKKDVELYLGYMDSLSISIGDSKLTQENYFAFSNWFFASVFMPYLRLIAVKNGTLEKFFPVFGIIYGESNGGKTTIVNLLSKMMCGTVIPDNPSGDFTQTKINTLKANCEGLPIYIDDLAKEQYTNNNEKIIKDDTWGIKEQFINYPAVVVTTNRLPAISKDISKRVFICKIDSKIETEEGLKNSRRVMESISRIGTALFCEYVRRMIPQVLQIEEEIKRDVDDLDYIPDIFLKSSTTLKKIFAEYVNMEEHDYVRELSYFECMGDVKKGKSAMEKIMLAYKNEPKQFKVDKKQNTLIYDCSAGMQQYEVRHLIDELPIILNARKTQTKLIMDLDKAIELFGVDFKRHFRK